MYHSYNDILKQIKKNVPKKQAVEEIIDTTKATTVETVDKTIKHTNKKIEEIKETINQAADAAQTTISNRAAEVVSRVAQTVIGTNKNDEPISPDQEKINRIKATGQGLGAPLLSESDKSDTDERNDNEDNIRLGRG